MILTRRRLADACLWGSLGVLGYVALRDLRGAFYFLAGLDLALMAALLLTSAIARSVDLWWAARATKMEADRDLAVVALQQWESQVKAQGQTPPVVLRTGPIPWAGKN